MRWGKKPCELLDFGVGMVLADNQVSFRDWIKVHKGIIV